MNFYKDSNNNIVFSKDSLNMEKLVANTTDAIVEKHLPKISYTNGNLKVSVGEISHPMTKEHFISFVFIETETEGIIHYFKELEEPIYECKINSPLVRVYSYCNLHGLWKVEKED